MRPPVRFRKNGYDYRLLAHNACVALYGLSKGEKGCRAYEVLIVRPARLPPGNLGRPVDTCGCRLPSNEEFGTYAWSFQTEEAAQKKYEQELEARR